MADAKAIPAGSQSSGGGALPPSFGSPLSHQNRLLASLPQSDMALLAPSLQVISVPPGAVLQFQEDPIEYLYFPHEGLVSLRAMTPDGHTIQATSIGRAGAVCPALKLAVREALLTAVAL